MRYLNIGGYTFEVSGYEGELFEKRMAEYFAEPGQKIDLKVTYGETNEISPPDGEYISTSMGYRKFLRKENEYQIYDVLKEPDVYSAAIDYRINENYVDAKLFDVENLGGASLELRSFNMLGEIFKYFVLQNGGMVLHSSALSYKGNGVIFSAPSGTGKSTHTRLWRETFGDSITMVNDDSPVLRFFDDRIKMCGTPWSGKTDINHNISVPLRAIVMLYQSPDNNIRRLSVDEAVFRLMNEVVRPAYSELMDITLKNIERIITAVPIYMLGCNISEDAARLAKNTIFGEEL